MRILRRESRKRGHNNKYQICNLFVFLTCKTHLVCNVYRTQARVTVRGPLGSTIISLKEIIRCNHFTQGPPRFLPTRSSSLRGLPPPLREGYSSSKESPVLPIPSYPALCREDTTSWNHGRPGTHHKRERITTCIHLLHGSMHVCHAEQETKDYQSSVYRREPKLIEVHEGEQKFIGFHQV